MSLAWISYMNFYLFRWAELEHDYRDLPNGRRIRFGGFIFCSPTLDEKEALTRGRFFKIYEKEIQ